MEEFTAAINQINNTLDDYWPCDFCFYCGYGCCLCTLGLSLFCPNLCISDVSEHNKDHAFFISVFQAEGYARKQIARLNDRVCFKRAGIIWDLKKSWGNSWVEISYRVPMPDHF
jgi:hypothetical protein